MVKQGISIWAVVAIIGFLMFCVTLSYLAHKSRVIVDHSGKSEKEKLIEEIK